jgi:aquaporin related protein
MSRSYWLGPALGATVAAGFYKFIKYLEYETVLGPEDGDAPAPSRGPAQGSMLSGGAPAMTGPNVAAGKMYEEASASKGPTMAIQGAGLGDLLTHGAPSNVSPRRIRFTYFRVVYRSGRDD